MSNILKLRVVNHKTEAVQFRIEPWGDFWLMPAGTAYELHIEVEGNLPIHCPEITVSDEEIVVYAGVSGDISVYENGLEINSSILSERVEVGLLQHAA